MSRHTGVSGKYLICQARRLDLATRGMAGAAGTGIAGTGTLWALFLVSPTLSRIASQSLTCRLHAVLTRQPAGIIPARRIVQLPPHFPLYRH